MNQRIRYIKNAEGNMVGNKFFRSKDGTEYFVEWKTLKPGMCAGRIASVDGNYETDVYGSSPHKIKIKLKRALMELGCEFEKEKRELKKEGYET